MTFEPLYLHESEARKFGPLLPRSTDASWAINVPYNELVLELPPSALRLPPTPRGQFLDKRLNRGKIK